MSFSSCFLCLSFVELLGTVGLCFSLHFEKFWPLFLKIFFLFQLCVLSLQAPVPGVFHYLKLSPNSWMLCSFFSVIFLSMFHLHSFYSSAFKFTTFSFTVFSSSCSVYSLSDILILLPGVQFEALEKSSMSLLNILSLAAGILRTCNIVTGSVHDVLVP